MEVDFKWKVLEDDMNKEKIKHDFASLLLVKKKKIKDLSYGPYELEYLDASCS